MKKSFTFDIVIIVLGVFLSVSATSAPIGESAGESWISGPDQPGTDPDNPDADMDSEGRVNFVWDTTTPTNKRDIFLRVFPNDKDPLDPIQVNSYVEDEQHFPKIAINTDGSFLVVWLSKEKPASDITYLRNTVRSQAFDANANPLGEEWIISTLNPNLSQDNKVDIDVLPNGEYIVVWRSRETFEPGDSSVNIQGRRIAANGVPLAEQFQINSTMTVRRQSIWHHLSFFLRDTFLPVLSPV